MANSRMLYPHMDWATSQCATVVGSFEPVGVGAVVNVRGDGFTVARTGVGEYTVTLSRNYPQMVVGLGSVQDGSGADTNLDMVVTTELYGGVASPTLIIKVARADGTSGLEDLSDTSRISFYLVLQKYTALSD